MESMVKSFPRGDGYIFKESIMGKKYFVVNINSSVILVIIPMLNLIFMHYFFYLSDVLEWTWAYSEIINICNIIFDVFILLIISLLIVCGRFKPAIAITQILTLIWSFVNVMYGKFFFQYMSLSAIGEAHGLGEGLVINSVVSAFRWYDIYYLLSAICFIYLYLKTKPSRIKKSIIIRLLTIPTLSLLVTFIVYSAYHFALPHYRNNWELYKFRTKELLFDSVIGGTPNLAHFQTGCIRVIIYEIFDSLHKTELTEEQRKQIEVYYQDYSQRTSYHKRNPNIKNVIFILLESFLSSPIDKIVDGKEITPFLNSLKRDSNVYYNGNMISDIGCGESGDGQFIYMTGILPLKYKMTVGQVKNNSLPALPKVLKKEMGIKHTEIIFPTVPFLWQQADMNVAYGIDHAYSYADIVGDKSEVINDEKIFKYAEKSISESKAPFFYLILSVSAHSPYDNYVGENLGLKDKMMSKEYKNYLNTCHYTDKQIMTFINALKSRRLYDSSMIVIASDHYAHLDMLKMDGQISMHTPLFVINNYSKDMKSWTGEFHQLDTYTTMLDLLAINQQWRGLGHTMLLPSYNNSVNSQTYDISNMIIEGDYFGNINYLNSNQ